MHLLSFDVEDWEAVAALRLSGRLGRWSGSLPRQLDRVRRLLDHFGVRATFFWLGCTAAAYPNAVRALKREGHEIASHGYGHVVLGKLKPRELAADLRASTELLGQLTGERPLGYRAPEFSLTKHTRWALSVIADAGFVYDSSVFPIRHRRYGIPDFPRHPTLVHTTSGPLVELPLASVEWWGFRWPIAGGGYFRWVPRWLMLRAWRRFFKDNTIGTAYFHPYEFDKPESGGLIPSGLTDSRRLRELFFYAHQHFGRQRLAGTFEELLKITRFGPCRDHELVRARLDELLGQSRRQI